MLEKLKEKMETDFLWKYSILYVLLICLYIFLQKIEWLDQMKKIELAMQVSIIAVITGYMFVILKEEAKELKEQKLLTLIVIIGLIMRIGYTMYTPWYMRGHDIGNLTTDDTGHASYILHLYAGKFPDSNEYQFYHPPLYHILSAITMHIVAFITGKTAGTDVFESSQIISCLASCAVLYQVKNFLKELKMKSRESCLIMAIVAFLPNFYFLAGRINNDSLVVFFMIMAIRYTYKWAKNSTYQNLIPLALGYGLGMMTKTSCGTLALFSGVWMLVVFYRKVKIGQWKPILLQFIIFGGISFPIGLWYQIRNWILFKQPFQYVLKLGANSPTYTGDYSFMQRFNPFLWSTFWKNFYNSPYEDYNVPAYLIKSALFGEFTFEIENFIPKILLLCNVILVILSLVAMIWILIKGKEERNLKIGLFFLWAIQMYSYFYFNLKFPNGCTMDFRYVVPTAVIGAVYLGAAWKEMKENEHIMAKMYCKLLNVTVIAFSVMSIVMFCNIA